MIYLGSDHGGFELKEKIKQWLTEWKLPFEDCGPEKLNPDDDYPQFAFAVSEQVGMNDRIGLSWKDRPKGILVCRSAGGMVIAANKVKGIRAVAATDVKSAEHSRVDNDANVLGLSGDWMDEKTAKDVVKIWLDTEFSEEERHKRRVLAIFDYEMGLGGGCCGGGCGGNCC